MSLTLSGTNGVVGAGFSITPGGAVAGIVTVGAAVTISESGIEASGIGITCASINGTQIGGRRNKIINGAMQVAQRGTSFTSTGIEITLDRFQHVTGSGYTFDTTTTKDSSAPDGFASSLKITPDATSTPSGSENGSIQYHIEGQDVQDFAYGTSSAKEITLSFYAKTASSNNGHQYTLQLLKHSGASGSTNRYQHRAFTVTSSWQRFVMTFTTDTDNGITNDIGNRFRIVWHLASGPDDIESAKTTWVSGNPFRCTTGQSNFMDNTSNEFYLTGVQLEVGDQATAFEHRSYGEELALCQRYYFKMSADGDYASGGATMFAVAYNQDTQYANGVLHFPTSMRTEPDALEQSGTASHYRIQYLSTNTTCNGVPTFGGATLQNARVVFVVASGLTAGQGSLLRSTSSSAYLAFSAEF